jgi:hypothetical protein
VKEIFFIGAIILLGMYFAKCPGYSEKGQLLPIKPTKEMGEKDEKKKIP